MTDHKCKWTKPSVTGLDALPAVALGLRAGSEEGCTCLHGYWDVCFGGTVYGECEAVGCYGVCAPVGTCDCPLHNDPFGAKQ